MPVSPGLPQALQLSQPVQCVPICMEGSSCFPLFNPLFPLVLPGLQAQADESVSDAGVAHLSGLDLRHLSLGGRCGVSGAGLQFLAAATQLTHLDLTAVRLGGVGGAAFLRHLRALACLRLGRTGMVESQFIGPLQMPGLTHLDVSYTYFSDRCCLFFSALPGALWLGSGVRRAACWLLAASSVG